MPKVRVVPESVPCECSVYEEIENNINTVMDDVVAALTRPLSEDEKSPQTKAPEETARIVFSGVTDEVNRFFYRQGWGDGLPLIPPTEEAVKEMLTGTDLPADHVVGMIVPRLGKATVEKIAINAVMAGALPIHMPVLIAAVKALVDSKACLGTYGTSTGSWAPMWIVNGSIRNEVHINSSSGALSPGDIANAAVGRAMGLIIKNIGGARKGVEDMGVLGNPGKYSLVIGEHEEKSPWDPLHVEQGLARDDSAVSLFFPNSFSQIWPYGSDDKGILSAIIYNLLPAKRGLTCIILTPPQALALSKAGWTKKMIQTFISQNATAMAYRHPSYWHPREGKEWLPVNAMDSVRLLRNAELIRVIVAGGPGNFMGIFAGAALEGSGVAWVTKKIEKPADWGRVVNKYKDLVPHYALY
ncbi:MAG: hypothetical protein JXA50_09580 [Deltaproteobacteria bacterium]|nr:hypothetical protein [Deltaproteobacteria bacterium]